MANVSTETTKTFPKMDRTFIGRAWVNNTKDGKVYINFKLDKGVKANLDESCSIQLWPNTKREGKKDADYRASVLIPAAIAA